MQLFARDYRIQINWEEEGIFTVNCALTDPLHDLILTHRVTIEKPTILSGSLQVVKAPNPECKQLELLPERLVGIRLDKGFTKTVLARLGGPQGCVNLVNMVLVSLPLVINTSWLYYAHTKQYSAEEIQRIARQQMSGVCLGYPPGDPAEEK